MDDPKLAEKILVATAAADLVKPGMALGLGSGSTASLFVAELGRRLADGRLTDVTGVATSRATADLAAAHGVPVLPEEDIPDLDLAIDGADEVDPAGAMLKGRGGALLREKLVAACAGIVVIMADSSKRVPRLGQGCPVVVEVPRFGWRRLLAQLAELPEEVGGPAKVTPRMAGTAPYVTDNGNLLLDVTLPAGLPDAVALDHLLALTPGVMAHGLFVGFDPWLIVPDGAGGVTHVEPQDWPSRD